MGSPASAPPNIRGWARGGMWVDRALPRPRDPSSVARLSYHCSVPGLVGFGKQMRLPPSSEGGSTSANPEGRGVNVQNPDPTSRARTAPRPSAPRIDDFGCRRRLASHLVQRVSRGLPSYARPGRRESGSHADVGHSRHELLSLTRKFPGKLRARPQATTVRLASSLRSRCRATANTTVDSSTDSTLNSR